MDKKGWIFIALTLAAVVFVFSLPPLHDAPSMTIYADQRSFWGIPNFNDVISNIPFIILGFMGLWTRRLHRGLEQGLWILFFGAVIGVGLGSGYYHLDPTEKTLFWDRMPIGLAFMSLLAVVLTERVSLALMKRLAPALILAGIGSVLYWARTDDLRPYLFVEFFPIALLPLLCLFFPCVGDRYIYIAVFFYILAKLCEDQDGKIFILTENTLSGHTLKHLLAAAGVYFIYRKSVISYNVPKRTDLHKLVRRSVPHGR